MYVMAFSNFADIGSILASGGSSIEVERRVPLESFEGWSFPDPARTKLVIQGNERLVEVRGTVEVDAAGICDRCLDDVKRAMLVEVNEELEPGAAVKDGPFSETNVLSMERLDVADLTRQLVLSSAPLSVLCGPDCAGLCPRCGTNRNFGACRCALETE